MSRRSVLLMIAVVYLALGGNADSEETSNDSGVQPTYRSGIEKLLQGIGGILPSSDSSDDGAVGRVGQILNAAEKNFHAIFPGTLWCGAGNIASSEEDIGTFNETDACCRAHDECDSNIRAGETKGPLYNDGLFTRSDCHCDFGFYYCLKNVSSLIATNIGTTYFNILRPQCFAYSYPIAKCISHGTTRIVEKKCNKYELDETKNKTYVWVDNLDY